MKIISFDGGRIGVQTDADNFVDITDIAGHEPGTWPPVGMVRLVAGFDALRPAIEARVKAGEKRPLDTVRLECPVQWPNKVIAFPANYHAHIEEMNDGLISQFKASGQGFFLKANSSLSGPSDPIVLPPIPGRETHHEAEMAIIIGKGGRQIAAADALDHIFGYACLLDIVVRGKEERVMRKSYDSFCPLGPHIITADEVGNPHALDLKLTVNGELRQQANTRDLIVDILSMIEMASAVMTLYPGDIIATGTPAGVAPIVDGDILDITIQSVGSMKIGVVQGDVGNHPVWDKSET
jgi:2-keto-4-pentenoate hydratase/2-oxohepta-3-ene-1,7-dioic acid hydratase in catechol pathway